jgi:hypothetical protein
MNPIPTTYTLGQRTMNFVGALQSLPIHSKEHQHVAHRILDKVHAPRYLRTLTPSELATMYRTQLTEAGLDADCVTQFTDIAVQMNLFRDVETLEDNVTPWVEPQS